MPFLSTNSYGKSRVRLVKVRREAAITHFTEWTIHISFEGDFARAYTDGDNSPILPTDSMKNTVYSLARSSEASTPEDFAGELVTYFLTDNPQVTAVRVDVSEKPWERLTVDGRQHPIAFRQAGLELRTTSVSGTRNHVTIRSGLKNLVIMKTANSGFSGYRKDKLTTLRETTDRLLGTSVQAEWTYGAAAASFKILRTAIRDKLLATFAGHDSLSVQHTLYAMGEAVLEAVPEVTDIKLTMPNIHCLLVDLTPFGQDNPNEIFVPIDEPHGTISAELKRA
jgi:urate oxidase